MSLRSLVSLRSPLEGDGRVRSLGRAYELHRVVLLLEGVAYGVECRCLSIHFSLLLWRGTV